MSSTAKTPNHDEGLSARSTINGQNEYLLSTNGVLNISGSGGGAGTQYANGAAVATPTGSVALGFDGTNVRAMKTDTSGDGYTIITDGTNNVNISVISGKNGLFVASNSATGSAVPANAFYMGIIGNSGNLAGIGSVNNTGDASSGSGIPTSGIYVFNGSTLDRVRTANAASATTGTGLLGGGILGYDGTNYQRVKVTNTGVVSVKQQATTSTNTSVAGSATSVTLLAANTARVSASIYNDSTAILYVSLTSTATTTAFKVPLAAGAYYEVPGGYNGIISGIWASATGNARIAEEA